MIPALYIHIPFCRKICPFCSFAVRPDHHVKHEPYFDLVRRELDLVSHEFSLDLSAVRSVYFGGGTPSRLSLSELRKWTAWVAGLIGSDKSAQWSIEVNPEDLTRAYADGLAEMGFQRVSLGIQSFRDQGLQALRRQHTSSQSRQAINHLLQAGFVDFNLDLMFGYPGQDLQDLQSDLSELVQWDPAHISAYCLTIEEKTPLYKRPQWQQWQDEHEKLITTMYGRIVSFLAKYGYRQYEISNFARKGRQSRQNLLNWSGKNYLGLGMGAHSLLYPQRWGNCKRWVDYKQAVISHRPPRQYVETLNWKQQRDEMLMLSLRQSKGLNLAGFEAGFDLDLRSAWEARLADLQTAGLVKAESKRLQLTVKGMMLADAITADLAALLDD